MTRSYHSSRSIATLFCLPFLLYASSDTKILFNMKRIVASEVKRYASTSTSKDIQRFSLCRFVLVFYCSVFIDDVGTKDICTYLVWPSTRYLLPLGPVYL